MIGSAFTADRHSPGEPCAFLAASAALWISQDPPLLLAGQRFCVGGTKRQIEIPPIAKSGVRPSLAALKGDRDSPWRSGGSGRNARLRLPQRLL
jgi:hypothetical protein